MPIKIFKKMFKRKNRDMEDVIYKRNQENGSEMMLCLLFVALLDVARGTIWTVQKQK